MRLVAESLPVIFEKHKISRYGDDLIKEYTEAELAAGKKIEEIVPLKDKDGKPMARKDMHGKPMRYIFWTAKPVNHYERIKTIFQNTVGDHARKEAAVYEYQQSVHDVFEAQQEKVEKNLVKSV